MAESVEKKGVTAEACVDLEIKDIFSQNWVAGVMGGGSGVNVHVYASEKSVAEGIELDTCFFEASNCTQKSAKLQKKRETGLFVAYFQGKGNSYDEMMMFHRRGVEIPEGGDPRAMRERPKDVEPNPIPYELEKGQAVITYKQNGVLKELKIDSVRTKEMIPYC